MSTPDSVATYWEQRAVRYAREHNGLPAVCSYGMPRFYNRAIEITQRRALLPWIRSWHDMNVLDVGCGVGRWSLQLARQGNEVTGVDLSQTMVDVASDRARDAGLTCHFRAGDIADLDLDRTFERILVVTVLQHILAPDRLRLAIANLERHLAPGGQLVMLEAAPTLGEDRCDTAVFNARDVQTYRQTLEQCGLRVTALSGVDPAPFKTWLLPHFKRLPRPIAVAALAVSTALSLPIDWLLGRALTRHSWHKIIVAKRQPSLG